MTELLAPAGNFDALVAAISNGADAIYLGMNQFGARAYSTNFDEEAFKKAITYAHLRNVKIFVTLNTIIFEDELPLVYKMIDFLNTNYVDGIIIQDLAVFDYIVSKYPNIEAHCSTQMGIDDLDGTLLFKKLGAKRVVLSREVNINDVKHIKKTAKIPIEIFIHGALCVSYSGNCLMSGLIGYRSGNRGRCVGSCRKPYSLINETTNEVISNSYILSMKDLNTLKHISELKDIDSLKIEGRMKEPAYVANVVSSYRNALDGKYSIDDYNKLSKTFHRTFTKGYLFNENKKEITNISRPNNYGVLIGKIVGKNKIGYRLELTDKLNQNDIIRIDHNNQDVNLTVVKLYDSNKNYISSADKYCYISIKEELSIGDLVYKTKDYLFYQEIEKQTNKEFKRFPINFNISAFTNQKLIINAECDNHFAVYESEFPLAPAINKPTAKENVIEQLKRLNDSVYSLGLVEFYTDNTYIPAKLLNEARRQIVETLNNERLKREYKINSSSEFNKIAFPYQEPKLAVYATTEEQFEAAKECGIDIIYYDDNVIRRNNTTYQETDKDLLVGGYGGIYHYANTNNITSDFSLNVVNSKAVHLLHSLGVNRVTLSYEMNKKEIDDLINNYKKANDGLPNLEMIVYGHTHLLYTKYCPLKKMNLCGKCKDNKYVLKDEYGTFPIISHSDCTTTLLNGKILNLIDDLESISSIAVYRLQFTIESKEETMNIIKMYQEKLKSKAKTKYFSSTTDTRGHFNKEIL